MIPTRIGQKSPGGHFAGINRIGNNCYAVIVSPKDVEATGLKWQTFNLPTLNTSSVCDGLSNTTSMSDSNNPAAHYCLGLVVDGCNDFYLPSKNELEICYRNLKPIRRLNMDYHSNVNRGNLSHSNGTNLTSIPIGKPYSWIGSPFQTLVLSFQLGGKSKFEVESNEYHSSTEFSIQRDFFIAMRFNGGVQEENLKTFGSMRTRAVRRILLVGSNV